MDALAKLCVSLQIWLKSDKKCKLMMFKDFKPIAKGVAILSI